MRNVCVTFPWSFFFPSLGSASRVLEIDHTREMKKVKSGRTDGDASECLRDVAAQAHDRYIDV